MSLQLSPAQVVFRGASSTGTQSDCELLLSEIVRALGLRPVTARALLRRGVTNLEEARLFLSPTIRHCLPNPNDIKGIRSAAKIIADAVESGEEITLFTDFDVDGLSAGAQLFLFLKELGARVSHVTPNRFTDGYGLTRTALEKLFQRGTTLLVTVDCGISSEKEIELATKRGMRVVVVDHHIPHNLPPAAAIVNPAQDGCPFQPHRLCAAGLVWMLLIVLRQEMTSRWGENPPRGVPDPKEYLDLAALGTICDMVPLTGLNRMIAHRGLEALSSTKRAGVTALKDASGSTLRRKLNAGHVSFLLGPRINAAGRLHDARLAFELLTTDDAVRARLLASEMSSLNDQRRKLEDSMRSESVEEIRRRYPEATPAGIAIFNERFHLGVLGIVAQRLVDEFYRPAAVMGPGEAIVQGERLPVVKGSVRSIAGFHVAEALQEISSLCLNHGGHQEAGGFTIRRENLESFVRAFEEVATKRLSEDRLQRTVSVDETLCFSEIDFELVHELNRLAPFGIGNPSPVFVTENVSIDSLSPFGDGNIRLRLSCNGRSLPAVLWRAKDTQRLRRGTRVSVVYCPEINSFQGVDSVQLNVREIW